MSKIALSLIAAVFILLSGCETNPPNSPDQNIRYGKVFVSAQINGAAIYLNNVNTGKVTPDTVSAPVGNNTVTLMAAGYVTQSIQVFVSEGAVQSASFTLSPATSGKVVMMEEFSNVSCVPCVVTNKIIKSLFTYRYSTDQLAIVKFPAYYPSPNDPMYLAAKQDCDSRLTYYTVSSTPTIRIDGTIRPTPTDSNAIIAAIEQQLALSAQINVSAKDTIINNTLKITVDVQFADTAGINKADLVLHTVVTEDEITYSNPPGSNGETAFYHVARKMLPNFSGVSLTNTGTEIVTYQSETVIAQGWNPAKLSVVAFVQNKKTKQVYQAVVIH